MNRDFRNVAIVAAALGLLVSLFVALRATDDDEDTTGTTATVVSTATLEPTPEPATTETTAPEETATPEPTATPSNLVTIRVDVTTESAEAGTIRRFSVQKGREVELTVTSEIADEVHVHGYDVMADVAPGAPATLRFLADIAGGFEIELEERGLQIAELEVRP